MIADAVVIIALHYVEKGLKAEKALREFQAEKEVHQQKEVGKDVKKAQKLAQKAQAKETMKTQKYSGAHKPPTKIQQPNKKNT